jgi:phosphopantetheinyl transferase
VEDGAGRRSDRLSRPDLIEAPAEPVSLLEPLPTFTLRDPPATASNVVDLWCLRYDDVTDPALWQTYESLMAPAERERHDRLLFARDRRLFLATRALVRTCLSHYADGIAPDAWSFAATPMGKPYLLGPPERPPLHFNLSNTSGLVVCLVSTTHQHLGVDAEAIARDRPFLELATSHFAPPELGHVRALEGDPRREAFLRYWTLKESYPLTRFHGVLTPRAKLRPRVVPRLPESAARGCASAPPRPPDRRDPRGQAGERPPPRDKTGPIIPAAVPVSATTLARTGVQASNS